MCLCEAFPSLICSLTWSWLSVRIIENLKKIPRVCVHQQLNISTSPSQRSCCWNVPCRASESTNYIQIKPHLVRRTPHNTALHFPVKRQTPPHIFVHCHNGAIKLMNYQWLFIIKVIWRSACWHASTSFFCPFWLVRKLKGLIVFFSPKLLKSIVIHKPY